MLVPEAKDAPEVNERIETLKERLAKAREGAASEPPLEALMRKGQEPPPEVAVVEPPPTQAATAPESDESLRASRRASSRRTLAWVALGGGGVLALGGVLSNVLARSSMSTCRNEYKAGNQSAADSACSNATPLAYLSYGLIGLGAAAVVAGAVLLIVQPSESSDVAVSLLPEGGLSLRWAGNF